MSPEVRLMKPRIRFASVVLPLPLAGDGGDAGWLSGSVKLNSAGHHLLAASQKTASVDLGRVAHLNRAWL
jgi:hypothetical protein